MQERDIEADVREDRNKNELASQERQLTDAEIEQRVQERIIDVDFFKPPELEEDDSPEEKKRIAENPFLWLGERLKAKKFPDSGNWVSQDLLFNKEVLVVFARLMLKLERNLPLYDTIISDDASGHLVSLVFRKIIDTKRKEMNKKDVQTYFVDPSHEDAIKKFLEKRNDDLGKILVVTEYMNKGRALSHIVEALGSMHFDIAILSAESRLDYFKQRIGADHFYCGEQGGSGSGIVFWGRREFSGVVAGGYAQKKGMEAHPVSFLEQKKKILAESGASADKIADMERTIHRAMADARHDVALVAKALLTLVE